LLLNIAQGFSQICQYEFLHCNGPQLKKQFRLCWKVASSFEIKMAKIWIQLFYVCIIHLV
jgi:hypothetical protein